MSAAYNDGTVQYGSRVITINSVAYVADSVSVTRPTTIIERTNENGEPSGSVGVNKFVTFTAPLQLASSSTAEPQAGMTTSPITFDAAIGAETFYIHSVGRAETKDGEKKLNVTGIKKYN